MQREEVWEKMNDSKLDQLYKELGMTKESIKRDLLILKTWLKQQPHLPEINDDNFLETVLFNCKNSLEAAKTKLDQYYCARSTIPEYFTNRDPCDPKLIKNICYTALPKLTKDGYRIIIVKLFNLDVKDFDPVKTNKGLIMLCDVLLRIDKSAGILILYETEGFTVAHTTAVPIRLTKNLIQCVISAFPQRIKGIHLINSSPVGVAFLNLNKLLLKEKLRKRLFIHSKGADSLFEHFDRDIIPEEFGGTSNMTMNDIRDLTIKYLREHRQFFLDEENIQADMSKKPEDENTQKALEESRLFGADGSFRSIHID